MFIKLIALLKYELELLIKLNRNCSEQQKSLIKYRIDDLDGLAAQQQDLSKKLREAEQQRISMLKSWLGVPMREVASMSLSELENKISPDDREEFRKIRADLRNAMIDLHTTNSTNRILNKRARGTITTIISFFTNGTNQICNVKV